jgi:hypothetical protein
MVPEKGGFVRIATVAGLDMGGNTRVNGWLRTGRSATFMAFTTPPGHPVGAVTVMHRLR